MKTEQGKNIKERKQKGKMRNKWPKHARENREISARLMHPDRTRVTQLLKYQNHHKCIVHGIRSVRQICSYFV